MREYNEFIKNKSHLSPHTLRSYSTTISKFLAHYDVKDIEDYQTSFQTRLYSWAFEQIHGRPPRGTMYDFFILNKTPKFDRTPVLPHNPADMPLVESMIKEYFQNIYWNHQTSIWPRDFSHCFDFGKKCDLWNHCHAPTEAEGLAVQVEIISGNNSKMSELW